MASARQLAWAQRKLERQEAEYRRLRGAVEDATLRFETASKEYRKGLPAHWDEVACDMWRALAVPLEQDEDADARS